VRPATFSLVAILAAAAQPSPSPNIPDLKVTTRRTFGEGSAVSIETAYFKGARQRRDSTMEYREPRDGRHTSTMIVDCQGRRMIMLNHEARTYASRPIENIDERIARLKRAALSRPPAEKATGPEVTTTIDSVDTGERRQLGRYTARHVVTTITTDAAPGASIDSSVRREDGWYVDLPDGNCSLDGTTFALLRASGYVLRAGQPPPPHDRERTQFLGRARRGLAIEESDAAMKIELVDFSEAPLDEALFAIPGDYRAALPTPYGGVDMTKPDTLLNRVELYCQIVTGWVQSVFR
jgi:hypothetical protein